ncbi:nuclear receptor ROR-beta-like isoform X2 [Physella acuta]|nr:nuclear receptor ROR-beta-like isoform X2 [Physella acuta]
MGRKRKQVDPENNSKTNLPPCRVCDAPGAGFHYGANTCEACKGFFHRSLKLHDQYKCDNDGQCVIEHGKDKLCQKCRYQKCLMVGMGKEAIKTGRYTSVKRTNDILEVKKLQRTVQVPTGVTNSSQILKLLRSPRMDTDSGSQNSCDSQIAYHASSLNNAFPTVTDSVYVNSPNFTIKLEPQTTNPQSPLLTLLTSSPVSQPPCQDRREKSPSMLESNSSVLSPLAVLSATATAVLSSSLTTQSFINHPSDTSYEQLPLSSVNSTPVSSPATCCNDHFQCTSSPFSSGTSGPLSNSSSSSSTCVSSQIASSDFLGTFCDSCGCNLENKDVSLLYQDKEKVVRMLVEAHECFVVPVFGRLSPEEQLRQQIEHIEHCKLHSEIFGTLPKLPDHEYDYIFATTGLDTDGRQHRFHRVSIYLENVIRGMVKFAKAIPGFGKVSTVDKVNLIKYSRQEFVSFSMYPSLNPELKVMKGVDNEWKCEIDMVKACNLECFRDFLYKQLQFYQSLQNLDLSEEEQVVVKAILIMAPDRTVPVYSALVEEIYWHLVQSLLHLLSLRHQKPNIKFAQIMGRITEARTQTQSSIGFIKNFKIEKYSKMMENPLLREMLAGIVFDFKDDGNVSD